MSDAQPAFSSLPGAVTPRVSVVIVNYRGADDTIACIDGLGDLDWPREHLEVIVVDNASGDGSAERIRAAAPEVTSIESKKNLGFAGGCNRGAAAATGAVPRVPQQRRPSRCPAGSPRPSRRSSADAGVACVASKVLDWDGTDDRLRRRGAVVLRPRVQAARRRARRRRDNEEADVLFATGAAMVIRAEVFDRAGGFDERYFMFFEDVDLGWRLWLLGYRVRYVPDSLVYHRHHASMSTARSLARALPARAQRAVHDLQELRRREPARRCCRRRSR